MQGIDEGIELLESRLTALKAIRAAYPDAWRSDDRWVSNKVTLEACDGFEVITVNDECFLKLYQNVGGGRIYRNWGVSINVPHFFLQMKNTNPDLFQRVLVELRAQCS